MSHAEFAQLRERLSASPLTPANLAAHSAALQRLANQQNTGSPPIRRIAVAGDCSVQLLSQAIACAVALEGELPQVHAVPYGEVTEQCLDRRSKLHAFFPDTVVLVPDSRIAVPPLTNNTSAEEPAISLRSRVDEYEQLWDALQDRGCKIIQHLLIPTPHQSVGVAERRDATSIVNRIQALNDALLEAGKDRVTWLEADRLASQIGLLAWTSNRFWHAGRIGFDPRFLPDYLPWFRGAWRAANGRTKKLLVLDLDDTLWGGNIGDDGLEGIALGPGHGGRGEAFAAWQQYLAQIAARGVVLAVCSKNDERVAAAALDHPCMELRREEFAAFVCNWQDKASNLRSIAADLNLGLDAMVFVDDNPAERSLVLQALPEVTVVDIGTDPAQFIHRFEAGHWFDQQFTTAEDRGRTNAYAARKQARSAHAATTDIASHLANLEMRGIAGLADFTDLPRLAQLELKTNQFNLTNRRYTQPQLATTLQDPLCVVLTMRLSDRFVEHGLISSLIATVDGDVLRIDNWLLSCRAFDRTVEPFMLRELAHIARTLGATAIAGEYIPTARNGVVADLFQRLGFDPVSPEGRFWHRDLMRPLDDLVSAIETQKPQPKGDRSNLPRCRLNASAGGGFRC